MSKRSDVSEYHPPRVASGVAAKLRAAGSHAQTIDALATLIDTCPFEDWQVVEYDRRTGEPKRSGYACCRMPLDADDDRWWRMLIEECSPGFRKWIAKNLTNNVAVYGERAVVCMAHRHGCGKGIYVTLATGAPR